MEKSNDTIWNRTRDLPTSRTWPLEMFILIINQLEAQFFFFTMSLFHASTCFEHHVLIVRRSKLYYTASGITTPIGGRPVHCCAWDGHLQSVMIREAV